MLRIPASINRYILCVLLSTGCCHDLHAQDRRLKEVRVHKKQRGAARSSDNKINDFAPGMQVLTIDSALMRQYRLQQLSTLLGQQSPVFIRSYGINSMATLNFRGSSAAQSQVYWNGVPLNNGALGMTDVSLLSVQFFDRIDIAYGGSASLLGSGNVGAAVMLGNESIVDSLRKHTTVAAEAGSYAQYKLSMRHSGAYAGWTADGRIMLQSAQNNFNYTDLSGRRQQMEHAQLGSGSAMLQLGKKTGAYSKLGISGWYQRYDRQVPAALFEASSAKNQQDISLRLLASWNRQKGQGAATYVKTAFFRDRMHYEDSQAALISTNITYQYYLEAGWSRQLDAHQRLLVFVPVNISWMRPERDTVTHYQYRTALAAAYHYQAFSARLQAAASIRAERINDRQLLLPGLNASFRLLPALMLRANVQKSYRAPTLNEWYYNPGGNPDLKPEYGWNSDAGYALKLQAGKKLLISHEASVFNRVIHDWILWFGGSIWTPHNIASVHSRGIETVNKIQWSQEDWHIYLGLNTSFVLATTLSSYIPGDGSIGKQIPYSPRYNGQASLGLSYRNVWFNYTHTYTGYRFITTDESQFLLPYSTGNLAAGYTFNRPALNLSLQINNIWQEQYEVVRLRPMPGRNFMAGAAWSF